MAACVRGSAARKLSSVWSEKTTPQPKVSSGRFRSYTSIRVAGNALRSRMALYNPAGPPPRHTIRLIRRCPLRADPTRAPVILASTSSVNYSFARYPRELMSTSQTVDPARILAQLIGSIGTGGIRVVDLTVPLEPATPIINLPPPFVNSKPFSLEEISRYDERGPAWYWNNIACGEHTGTHFDAPIHWVTGKDYANNATHNIPVDLFIGPACVIDVAKEAGANPDFLGTQAVIEAWEGKHGRIPS